LSFDAAGIALGLTLRTTLGIPRGSVGSQAVGVGADRLALAARTGRTGLAAGDGLVTFGAGRPGLAGRPRLAGRARRTRLERDRLTVGSKPRSAIAAIATTATATGSTRTTGTTRPAIARGTTAIAIATRTSATFATTTAAAEVTRRRGQLPADPSARHLAATGPIVFFRCLFRRAVHEAAEAARLGRSAIASEATTTASTSAAAFATTTALTAVTAPIATVAAAIATPAGNAIDDVMELAARHRAVRTLLALEHAHQTHLIDRATDDVERFEQTRCAFGLQTECFGDRADRGVGDCRGRGLGGCSVGRCSVGGCSVGRVGGYSVGRCSVRRFGR